jgi:poly(3-hydroxybutyrate) depolymerase
MNDIGYLYIPDVCLSEYCKLLVNLHGCGESAALWFDTYSRTTGLLEYAATNNIIVLFPSNNDSVPEFPWPEYCWSADFTDDKFNH